MAEVLINSINTLCTFIPLFNILKPGHGGKFSRNHFKWHLVLFYIIYLDETGETKYVLKTYNTLLLHKPFKSHINIYVIEL